MNFTKYFLLAAVMFCSVGAMAQTPVELHITHKLNGINAFSYNQETKNDLGNDLKITRLEYYISDISIKHDGGTITPVPNHYILVDAGQNLMDQLGSFNVTNVESISFRIGVDTPNNHADPSAQPNGHPLAPKSPSMHWGWASGYRFVALEGKSGANFDKTFELHGLFDDNYFEQTVTVSAVNTGSKIIIPLFADYIQALKGIDVSAGVVSHGVNAEDKTVLTNFRDHVFTAGSPVSVNNTEKLASQLNVYPNPSVNGLFNLTFRNNGVAAITISDVQGRVISNAVKSASQNKLQVQLNNAGVYFLKAVFDNGNTEIVKLVTQ